MNYEQMKEVLRKERERIASESHKRIEKINLALVALDELNGQTRTEAVPVDVVKRGRPSKATLVVRKREHGGEILKRIGLHYTDLTIEAARQAGRPVTTEEVFQYLQKLAGKRLNRKKYMSSLTVCLHQKAQKGFLLQTKVPGSHRSLWNAPNAAALQPRTEILSADIK